MTKCKWGPLALALALGVGCGGRSANQGGDAAAQEGDGVVWSITTTGVSPITRAVVRFDPLFDGIRDDPGVQALLKNDAAWVVAASSRGP